MANFRSGNRRGFGNRSGGSGSGFRGRSENRGRGGFGSRDRDSERSERSGPAEMHEAICDKCGKNCQVPFKPTGSKPVLCSDCFRQGPRRNSGMGSRGGFGSRDRDRRSYGPSQVQSGISPEQFNQLNAKLDKILGVLETLEMTSEEDSDDVSEEDPKTG